MAKTEKAELEKLRDQFAAAALTGIMARSDDSNVYRDQALRAYNMADAMMEMHKEREKRRKS